MSSLPISPNESLIIERIANGYSSGSISSELGIPIEEIQELTKRPDVQAEIQRVSQEVLKQFGSHDSIKNAMKRIIMSDLTDFYEDDGRGSLKFKSLDDIPIYLRQCITEFEVKNTTDNLGMPVQNVRIKVISKEKAIEILAKMEGLFQEKPQEDKTVLNIGFE